MSIDGISNKGVSTSNYKVINETKKVDSKNDEANDASKVIGTSKDLGTDKFVKSTDQDITNTTYGPLKKKLSTEEVQAIKDEQENLKAELIRKFIIDTINNQNNLLGKSSDNGNNKMSQKTTDLLTSIFGSVENAYPPLATTKEGAIEAISEGGPYSVNAVADRIMTMATTIAGEDPKKLQQMRDAVEKGFSQAGLEFSKATKSDLPQISKDTYSEIMKRFDELQNKTSITD